MITRKFLWICWALCGAPWNGGSSSAVAGTSEGPDDFRGPATFVIRDSELPSPFELIVYGGTSFTDPADTAGSQAAARRAVIARIASEHPAAVIVTGDLPLRGRTADYGVYEKEITDWKNQQLKVFPALGNQEFSQCATKQCLDRWWNSFPQLRGHRWYSVRMGGRFLAIVLDSNSSLQRGSEQRQWLEKQIGFFSTKAQFILIVSNRPALADIPRNKTTDLAPASNEIALSSYLDSVTPHSSARYVVCAGGVHNYERFSRNDVIFLVSGGGGAEPDEIDRSEADLYDQQDFPNYHYVRFTSVKRRLVGEMVRLENLEAKPVGWAVRDRFDWIPASAP